MEWLLIPAVLVGAPALAWLCGSLGDLFPGKDKSWTIVLFTLVGLIVAMAVQS